MTPTLWHCAAPFERREVVRVRALRRPARRRQPLRRSRTAVGRAVGPVGLLGALAVVEIDRRINQGLLAMDASNFELLKERVRASERGEE